MLAHCSSALDTFFEWLHEDERFHTLVEIHDFADTGRGLMASRDIKKGERVLQVPIGKIFTPSVARNIVKAYFSTETKLTDHRLLSIALALERKSTCSQWKPYFDMMPDTYSLPIATLSKAELELLPDYTRQDIENQKKRVLDDYTHIKSELCTSVPFKDFLWAWMAVNTRVLCLMNPKGRVVAREALVPYFDMFNHSPDVEENKIYIEDGCLVVVATRDHCKGEQVFISYGPHDNAFLWREYGFIHNGNKYDYYHMYEAVKAYDQTLAVEIDRFGIADMVITREGPSWNYTNGCRILSLARCKCDVGLISSLLAGTVDSLDEDKEAVARMVMKEINNAELETLKGQLNALIQLNSGYSKDVELLMREWISIFCRKTE